MKSVHHLNVNEAASNLQMRLRELCLCFVFVLNRSAFGCVGAFILKGLDFKSKQEMPPQLLLLVSSHRLPLSCYSVAVKQTGELCSVFSFGRVVREEGGGRGGHEISEMWKSCSYFDLRPAVSCTALEAMASSEYMFWIQPHWHPPPPPHCGSSWNITESIPLTCCTDIPSRQRMNLNAWQETDVNFRHDSALFPLDGANSSAHIQAGTLTQCRWIWDSSVATYWQRFPDWLCTSQPGGLLLSGSRTCASSCNEGGHLWRLASLIHTPIHPESGTSSIRWPPLLPF